MSGTVFRTEFGMSLRSVVTWSLAQVAILMVFFSIFTSWAADAALLNEMMADFPEALLAAFGISGVDLSTVEGYFSFIFTFVQICLAVQAANYGFALVSVEERELTADFLLVKPLTRAEILNSKLLASLCGLAITDLVVWASSVAAIRIFAGGHSYDSQTLVLLLLSIVPFQLVFLAVGLVVSLLMKRIRSVTPYSMALALGLYVLSAFSDMLGKSVLELITPFRHFYPSYIVEHQDYDLPLVLVSVAVTVISLAASYLLYNRRDMSSAV